MIEPTEKIVAIGASTGGTEALRVLLEALPADAPGNKHLLLKRRGARYSSKCTPGRW